MEFFILPQCIGQISVGFYAVPSLLNLGMIEAFRTLSQQKLLPVVDSGLFSRNMVHPSLK